MELLNALEVLSDEEQKTYFNCTTSEFFRNMYYSKEFSPILRKLNTKEELTAAEWDYIITRLFLITCKAITEEDEITFIDKIIYILSKLGFKISIKNGRLHDECYKMIKFVDCISKEKDINTDLTNGLRRVYNNSSSVDLEILLRQHREAVVFRNNQDGFLDSYKDNSGGNISDNERIYINSMERAYNREKELVKEYK